MSFLFLLLFGTVLEYNKGCVSPNIQNKIKHCRDNENKRVAWWYIYKPPADTLPPYTGSSFTFVTPDTEGRWHEDIAEEEDGTLNMLKYTMKPAYRKHHKKKNYRAVVVFEPRIGAKDRTLARGVMMAQPEGGFLLMHTVPGFPVDINKPDPLFPEGEKQNGHLISCVSLNVNALNKVGKALKEIEANFTYTNVPDPLSMVLRDWYFKTSPIVRKPKPSMYYLIRGNESGLLAGPSGSAAALMAQSPGQKNCIYASFAARQLVMLNVYGQSRSTYLTTICSQGFGVRNLDSLCMKLLDYQAINYYSAYYVTNSPDYSWFAVSTAAHWQQKGSGPRQFWVCTSLVDKEELGDGGLLLCLQNYNLWVAFDNLKVAEPSC